MHMDIGLCVVLVIVGVVGIINMNITIDSFGYRDKAITPIASLFYMQEDNYPPLGLIYNEDKKGFYETITKKITMLYVIMIIITTLENMLH